VVPLLKHVVDALGAFLAALPGWFRKRYLWVLLLAPTAWVIVVYRLAARDVFGWGESGQGKGFMEILHPALLAGGTLLALAGWALSRNASTGFMGAVCALALSRELGGQGTSIVMLAGLVGLVTWAHGRRPKLATLLDSRLASSLLATGFICYAASQVLDRGIAKRIGRLLLWDGSWEMRYASQIEESLEAFGGACLLLAVLAVVLLAARRPVEPTAGGC
jgi:hypothetical protein